jgi:hypothetical protein
MSIFSLTEPLPESAYLSLGGYRSVRPAAWQAYLSRAIRTLYPGYYVRHLFRGRRDQRWLDNTCVMDALAVYIFDRFGILLPHDNLFRVFNERGLGVLPVDMVAVIQALVAPLGLKIDRLVVPDDQLAQLVDPTGLRTAREDYPGLDGLPGVAMINIAEGYSHAFFWNAMQARKFDSAQFRMAITLKLSGGEAVSASEARCPADSLRGFYELAFRLLDSCGKDSPGAEAALENLAHLLAECGPLDGAEDRARAAAALGQVAASFPRGRQRAEVVEAAGLAQAALGADIRQVWRAAQPLRFNPAGA